MVGLFTPLFSVYFVFWFLMKASELRFFPFIVVEGFSVL